MKKTVIFIAFLSLVLRGVSFAQNPYQSIGKEMPKGKMLTLSNGKFQEFFPNDTLVPIGSVMYNTVTGEVVAFLTRDTMYAEYNLEPELVSRWLSPDPLAEKYMQWSPYVYTMNNPVKFIDPDGKEVVVPKVEDRAKVLEWINSRAQGTYDFNKEGKLYLKENNQKEGHSKYYAEQLNSAIKDKKTVIEIAVGDFTVPKGGYNAGEKGEYYGEGGKTYDIAAGKNDNELPTQYVFIEGTSVDNLKDTKGNPLRDEPADILAHEVAGHAVPRTQGKGYTGNAIKNENKVRAELKGRKDLPGADQQRVIKKNSVDEAHSQ